MSITLFDLVVCWTTLGPVWAASCFVDSARATLRSPRLLLTAFWYACNQTSRCQARQDATTRPVPIIARKSPGSPKSRHDKPDRPAFALIPPRTSGRKGVPNDLGSLDPRARPYKWNVANVAGKLGAIRQRRLASVFHYYKLTLAFATRLCPLFLQPLCHAGMSARSPAE